MTHHLALAVALLSTIRPMISVAINPITIVNGTETYSTSFNGTTIQYQWPDEIICNTIRCEVYCDITSGCASITINAAASNSLILQCTEESSCESVEITGPNSNVDIYCMNQRACAGVNFNLDNTTNINLECNTATSTSGNTGACLDSTVNANYAENVHVTCTNGQYNCKGINFYVQYVTNNVEFNIGGYQSLYWATIYAENIHNTNGLTMNCNTPFSCYQSNINCPYNAPCNISCSASKSCYLSKLKVIDKYYSQLDLDCGSGISDSCASIDVICSSTNAKSTLDYLSVTDIYGCPFDYGCCPLIWNKYICDADVACNVNCITQSCHYWIIDASAASALTVQCSSASATDGYGCIGADIICPAGDSTSCSLICTDDYCCDHISVITKADTMDTFSLECTGANACQYGKINTTLSVIDTIDIDCNSNAGCTEANFYFQISDTTSLDINCVNSITSTHSSYGSCNKAKFNISAAENSNPQITIPCGENDCYYAIFNFSNVGSATLQCNAESACRVMDVYASNVETFQIDCDGTAACSDSNFYCPYSETDTCIINCGEFESSCVNVNIHVDDDFAVSYLDLSCPNSDGTITDSCWGVEINCDVDMDNDNMFKTGVSYIWYDQYNSWGCANTMPVNAYCCPWATESPTSMPSEIPTRFPSVSPITTTYGPTIDDIGNGKKHLQFSAFVFMLSFFVVLVH